MCALCRASATPAPSLFITEAHAGGGEATLQEHEGTTGKRDGPPHCPYFRGDPYLTACVGSAPPEARAQAGLPTGAGASAA